MLQAHQADDGVQFDSDVFTEADIDALIAEIGQAPGAGLLMAEPPMPVADVDVRATDDQIDRALVDALDLLKENPEIMAALAMGSEADAMAASRQHLVSGLQERSIVEDVAQSNVAQRASLDLVTEGSIVSLNVDGRVLLRGNTDTARGTSMAFVIQAIVVVIDVMYVIAAIVNLALMRGAQWAKKIADTAKSIKNTLVEFCRRFMTYIQNAIPALRAARGSSSWMRAVKDACASFGPAIFKALKGTRNIAAALRDVAWSLFAGNGWQIAAAVLSLAGAILCIVMTLGTSLVAQITYLVAQVAFLASDSIKLAEMQT